MRSGSRKGLPPLTAHQTLQRIQLSGPLFQFSRPGLNQVLQLIMEKSLELLDAEAGSVLLADADGTHLTFEVVLSPVGNQLLGARQAIGSGIVGDRACLVTAARPRADSVIMRTR